MTPTRTLVACTSVLALSTLCMHAEAQSQVTAYGAVSLDVVSVSNVVSGGSSSRRTALDGGSWSPSRIGFRGTEDLGGGLIATFGIESGLSPDTGATSGTFWNRGATVGLQGAFGTLAVGRQWNLNDDIMGNYFIFGGYAAFRYTEFDWLSDLTNNSVKYTTPKIGGVQAGLLYSFGEQPGSTSAGSRIEVAGSYEAGPFSIALSHDQGKSLTGSASDKLTTLGANYRFADFRVRGGYAISRPDASGLRKATSLDIGADYFGAGGALRVSLDHVSRDQKGTGNDTSFVRLVGDYSLSKRTGLTANLIHLKNRGTASEHFYGDGAAGQSQTVITFGMRHNF